VRSTVVEVDPVSVLEGRLEAAAGNGASFVALEVQDTGCGMDESTQAKIFDPFFSTKFTGRGLGLSAVKGFVRSNGGAIRVRSVPGEGALFQVALPVAIEKRCQSATGGDT